MKYIALLSGGKDSCFNLLHCRQNGHDIVAAASLRPEQGKEELDSYLYQTVGQDAIEFVARALDVPLYRGTIVGTAVERGSEYGARSSKQGIDGDETEDLYNLLATVKARHPDVQGVSVGAILSNYQRVRVEHVCQRLSLTCLCYLWQRKQDELLSEMIEAGMEAIIIKVAGIGLTTKHLGKSLAEMRPTLIKLNDLYGSHICGEGGEYESLTLDCPLFKSRIVLTEVETVIHSDNDFATVAYLRIKDARLEPKTVVNVSVPLTIPSTLDKEFKVISETVTNAEKRQSPTVASPPDSSPSPDFPMTTNRKANWIVVSNVQVECSAEESIEEEVTKCFHLLREQLSLHGLTLAHSTNINLFLASMDNFARANVVYSSFFGTSPPSRACVALDLPPGVRVRIDCLAFAETSTSYERQALHVQSQSYWAPANIGPYSQAILAGERLSISGQIGLLPSSITLPSPRSLATETALSMQHVNRVVAVLRNGWEGHTQLAIYWLEDARNLVAVRKAIDAYNGDQTSVKLLVVVKALPKGALIEKQVAVHTGRAWLEEEDFQYEEDGKKEFVLKSVEPLLEKGDISAGNLVLHWEASQSHEASDSVGCALLCIRCDGGEYDERDVTFLGAQLKNIRMIQHCFNNALSIRNFLTTGRQRWIGSLIRGFLDACFDTVPPVTSIPSRCVATQSEEGWDFALVLMN